MVPYLPEKQTSNKTGPLYRYCAYTGDRFFVRIRRYAGQVKSRSKEAAVF